MTGSVVVIFHRLRHLILLHLSKSHAGWLVALSILLHALISFSMQARYWYDTVVYFELAHALLDGEKLKALYAHDFGILFNHIGPGMPALIRLAEALFGESLWVGIATFQVLVNAVAMVWLVRSFGSFIGLRAQFLFVALISLHPFFAAYHNAILTESIAASMWAFALGAFVRGLEGRLRSGMALAIMLAAGFAGAQFRSYIIVFPAFAAFILIYSTYRFARIWLYLLPAAVLVSAVLAFPIYRASHGVGFFLPNVKPLMLVHASYVAWDLTPRQQGYLEEVVLDPDIRRRFVGKDAVGYSDALKMTRDLVASGATMAEAASRIDAAAFKLRFDTLEIIVRQLQSSLSSLGFQRLVACCSLERVLQRGEVNSAQGLAHLQNYYAWAAGLSPSDYAITFQTFLARYKEQPNLYSPEAIKWYAERVGRHITASPNFWRDPLKIGLLSPDLVALLGIIGIVWMTFKDPRIGAGLLAMLCCVYIPALLASFVGDNRHSHVLQPIYVLLVLCLASAALSASHQRFQWGIGRG